MERQKYLSYECHPWRCGSNKGSRPRHHQEQKSIVHHQWICIIQREGSTHAVSSHTVMEPSQLLSVSQPQLPKPIRSLWNVKNKNLWWDYCFLACQLGSLISKC
jgi:hypothetical protein